MTTDQKQLLATIGLGGDGDEVAAIRALERQFGVSLDHSDAPDWETAGDVFASLQKALAPDQRNRPDLWATFARIICDETGADPCLLGPDTLLLALPMRTILGSWLRRLFSAAG